MTRDHFVPRLIIRNFADSNGNIRYYSKEKGNISSEINHYTQLQKENFHSKRTLRELKDLFKHIEINPIFNDEMNSNLETALGKCLETPMGVIVSKIINKFNKRESILLSEDESNFVKEYIAVQHIRTLKFKMISKKFNEKFSIPSDFGEQVISIEGKREPDIKGIIMRHNPTFNRNQRRVLELKWRKILKKNPNYLNEIRQNIFDESLDEMVKKAEADIKEILNHLDKHSSDIINKKQRDSFFKRCEIEKKDVKIIINLTKIPFVLGDTGIVIMSENPEATKNLEVFLPIHPNLLIGLSESLPKNALIDDNFVANFNRIAKEDSYKNVYSISEATLNNLS
jgi:hypothetical protein